MKKFLTVLITTILLLNCFNAVAQTDNGYTHLSVASVGNSKLYLKYGETDTNFLKFVDYMGYSATSTSDVVTNESTYTGRALRYTREKNKASNQCLYLNAQNIWTVRGLDYVLEPTKKVIKLFKHSSVTLDDEELVNKIKEAQTATVDVQDGYYSEINILACQDQYQSVNVNVEVFYEDKTSEKNVINIDQKPYDESSYEYGYLIAAKADTNDAALGKRFHGYTIKTNETKAVTEIKYTVSSNWRPVYIISQMAKNADLDKKIAETNELINKVINADEIGFADILNYVKVKYKINTLKTQFDLSGNEFENYDRFISESNSFETKLTDSFDIYVSLDGNKNASGTKNAPLDSIQTARDLIEEAKRYDVPELPINVIIRGGEYYLNESIVFEQKHSGTENAPITYKACDGEKVIFTSSNKIDTSKFTNVTDENILSKIPVSAQKSVKQIDLSEIADIDRYLPNAAHTTTEDVLIISNNRQQPVAQYPNGDMNMELGLRVINKGETAGTTLTNSGGGSIEIRPEQAEKWKNLKSTESYVQGAFHAPWRFERILIDSVKTEDNSLNFYSGSYAGLEATNWGGIRYKIMHALQELDTPGEWYIDRETDILYYYPDEPLETSEMKIAVNKFDLFTFDTVSYMNFEDITFNNSRGSALVSEKLWENINIKNCTFENIAMHGIDVRAETDYKAVSSNVNSSYNLNIEGNSFIGIGNYAYYNIGSGHVGKLIPSGNVFKDNYIYDCSCLAKYYMMRITSGVGDKVVNNFMHKSELGGFGFTGNNMFIAYNEVYNVGQNASDCAGIYTGRTYVYTNNEIAYNYVHDSAPLSPQLINHHRGIYLDDGASGQYVHNNIASNVTYMTSATGKKNRVKNNIIVGESKTPINLGVSAYLNNSQMINPLEKARNPENYGEIWLKEYEWLEDVENWTDFKNDISGNVTQLPIYYDTNWETYNNKETTLVNNVTLGVGNYEPFVDPENHDFRIKAGSEVIKTSPDAPNENNFSMDLIGLGAEKEAEIQSKLNKTHSPFNAILPKEGCTVSKTKNLFFMWQTAKYADEYEFKLYKGADLSTPIYEKVTGTNYVEIENVDFENTDYVWTVCAKIRSKQFNESWYSNIKFNRFYVSEIAVNEDVYEYIDLRSYNNAIAFMEIGDTTQTRQDANKNYMFRSNWAPNIEKVRNALDKDNMVKVGEVYYMLNQLDDKYKGLYNYNKQGTDYEIDVPDNKYEKIYILAEMDVQDAAARSIIVKYSDGSEEKLSLGEQVKYSETGVSGAVLPQIYTGAVWIQAGTSNGQYHEAGVVRGDWFRAGLYSHPVTPDKNKTVTSIIIPCHRDASGNINVYGFTTYAITLKVADGDGFETVEIKNTTNEDKSLSIITTENNKAVKITDISVPLYSTVVRSIPVTDSKYQIYFWNIETLRPYTMPLQKN